MDIYIVWGFLGSGKTTFINYFLSTFLSTKRVVVLENESGKESVDGLILRNNNIIVRDLKSGCICGTLRGELSSVIYSIKDELAPEVLLVEPSGIASLEDLIGIRSLQIKQIITMVDTTNYHLLMKMNRDFYRRQYGLSSVLLLTKTELVEEQKVDAIVNELIAVNPSAFISRKYNEIDMESWERLMSYHPHHWLPIYSTVRIPTYKMETFRIREKIPLLAIDQYFQILKNSPVNLVRGKGIVRIDTGGTVILDYVCGILDIYELPEDFSTKDSFLSLWWTNIDFDSLKSIVEPMYLMA